MSGEIQPLDQNFPIVDEHGRPTLYFIQWAQQKQIDIGGSITLQDLIDYLTAHALIAGTGIGLTPNGDINSPPTISAKVQEILDEITNVQGSILYRSGAAWAQLAPGAAGQFLKTNGAGADPTWAAAGGGATWDFVPATAASFTLLSGDATNLTLADDGNVGLLVAHGATTGSVIFRTAYRALTNKALDWTLVTRIRRLHENRNFRAEGLIIMDSIGGKCISFELRNDQAGPCVFEYSNLTGTFVATLYSNPVGIGQDFQWQRIRHTGGNYLFDISADGKQWANVATVGDVAFLANRADRVGFMGMAMNAGGPAHMFSSPYWSLTGPGV